ncbi:MAG: hypothetical protein QNJ84_18930 [Alphaproteobacteria bacterium]|nr:hypothetical protein [Alphaproteobacteria bacterium]
MSLFRGNLGWGDTNAGMLTITRNPFETRRSPRFQVPFSGGTDFAGPFAREPRPDETDIFSRLYNRTAKAVRRVWDVDDPLGFDPDEIAAQRQLAARYPVLGPIQYFNEVIGYPATVFADSALRSVPAALHGGAALAGQSIDEFGASKTQGRQLERGIVNFGNYLGLRVAGAGGAGGAAVQGAAAAKIAHEAATARRFVSGPNGSINFGQVGSDIAAASAGRFPAAPIRIQLGRVGPTDFGVRHLTPDKHIRARNLGYSDGVALVQDVARSNDVAIGQVNGRLMLAQLEDVGRYAVF